MVVTALICQEGGRLNHSLERYLHSLRQLAKACDHLVLFLDHTIAPPDLPEHVEIHFIGIHELQTAARIKAHVGQVQLPSQRNIA